MYSNVTVQDAKSPVVTCVNGCSYDILNTMPEPSITIPASDIEASPATDACGIDTIYLGQIDIYLPGTWVRTLSV